MTKQRKIEARLRAEQIRQKTKVSNVSGDTGSQWSKMTSESRLIKQGHYQKTDEQAKLDMYRDLLRKTKAKNKVTTVIHIARNH